MNYYIHQMLYQIISSSSSEYAQKLHECGYSFHGKHFKLFTFSLLRPEFGHSWHINKDGTMSLTGSKLYLTLSSPINDFIDHLIFGLLEQNSVELGLLKFLITGIKKLDPPKITTTMHFTVLSPIVCSKPQNGTSGSQYLFPGDPHFDQILLENLCSKYELIHNTPFNTPSFLSLKIDKQYAKSHQKLTKLITLKEGHPDETRIKGLFAPFKIEAPKPLLEIGYDCGFGQKNSQGFGMVKVDETIQKNNELILN